MDQEKVFQLKVTLQRVRPPVWRRIQVTGSMLLSDLHAMLQTTMGWTDSHLHQFCIGDVCYGPPNPEVELEYRDEKKFRLDQVVRRPKERMVYEYDFGDGWAHDVVVESITLPSPDAQVPSVLAGKRRCPPEDVGGPAGYDRFLEIIGDVRHPEHLEMRDWWGGSFDPEAFSVDEVNRGLQRKRTRHGRTSNNTLQRPVSGVTALAEKRTVRASPART